MSTPSALNQLLRAKSEAESSLTAARSARAQWLAATSESNPANLTKKDIDHQTKAFQNKLLSLKWDCEDLEELANDSAEQWPGGRALDEAELRQFIAECKSEIRSSTGQLEAHEQHRKIFNKHGIILGAASEPTAATTTTTTTITTNPILDEYERRQLVANPLDVGEIHFDKTQVQRATTIFENSLYDLYENQDALLKAAGGGPNLGSPVAARQVFSNLSRPQTGDVYMNPNENEMILEMLEPEYYQPPAGLFAKARHNYAIRKLFDTERHKFLGTVALIFSFPILLLLFLVI